MKWHSLLRQGWFFSILYLLSGQAFASEKALTIGTITNQSPTYAIQNWNTLVSLLVFLVIGLGFFYLIWLNHNLKKNSKQALAKQQEQLESQIRERTHGLLDYHKFLQNIIDGVSDPVMVVDTELKVLTRNRAAQESIPEALAQKPQLMCYELSHHRDSPCDGPNIPCPFLEVMMTGRPSTQIHEIESEGKLKTLEVMATPLHDEKGQLTGIVESFHDISQHMRLMRRLSKKEQYLSTVMDSVHDGIVTIDKDTHVSHVNKTMQTLLGYTPFELKNTDVTALLSENDLHRYKRFREKRDLHRLTRLLKKINLEITAIHKDGHPISLELRLGEMKFADETQFLLILRNISARKKLQKDLEKSRSQFYFQDKMATVGHIAAGIIHEIGNPTASLAALVQELKEIQEKNHLLCNTCEAPMENIIFNINRIGNIINEVSDFTQPQVSELQLIDINHLIQNVANLMKYEQTIKFLPLELKLKPGLPAINAKADQLTQVLMNLLINAMDACSNLSNRNAIITLSSEEKNNRIYVSVSDNGIGMDKNTLEQVFNIHFSTKAEKMGHGLGLSLCQSIVQQHSGEISLQSTLDQGTLVEFYIPAVNNLL